MVSLLTFLIFGALLFELGRFLSFIVFRLFSPRTSQRVVARVSSGIVLSSFFLYVLFATRSLPGRIVRFGLGSGLVKQEMEDRVDDLTRAPTFLKIQAWAEATRTRFRAGSIQTTGESTYGSLSGVQLVKLAPAEIPEFVAAIWQSEESPEISLGTSASRDHNFLIVAWHGVGIVFGDDISTLPIYEPDYQMRVVPGVFVYYLYD